MDEDWESENNLIKDLSDYPADILKAVLEILKAELNNANDRAR